MTLQKSYSERFGPPKQRQPWQRSMSHPVTPSRRVLQPVSEATKNKLSKFKFQDDQSDANPELPNTTTKTDDPSNREHEDTNTATPISRLKWQDLLDPNSTDEDTNDTSPNERIMWDTRQLASEFANLSPMMPRKSRKRARSSSPPASSPSAEKPLTPTVNVKQLAKALKSSHADPTLELWDRYSLHDTANKSATPGLLNPTLAQLMVSSSPRPARDVSKEREGHMRRVASCGRAWPKRRRLDSTRLASSAESDQRELEAASKSSLVTALLDTVNHSFHSHSSEDALNEIADSPCAAKKEDSMLGPGQARPDSVDRSFSDLGLPTKQESGPMPAKSGRPTLANPCKHSAPITPKPNRSCAIDGNGQDELDDFDDDLFDNAAEELVSHLEKQSQVPSQAAVKTVPAQRTATTAQGDTHMDIFDDDDFDDEFGGDIDFEALEMAATQTAAKPNSSLAPHAKKSKTIQRYLITGVLDGEYIDDRGRQGLEKLLLIQNEKTKQSQTVHLRGAWYDTPAHIDSYVHVIGQFSVRGQCIIDDSQNLLILHPDQLVSATVVADSFGCMRRAVLQDRVKATSLPTPPLIYGTILHEIFQEALLVNQWDKAYLAGVIDRIMEKHVEDLYTIKVGLATAREHLLSKMTELSYWAAAFVSSMPKQEATVEDRGGKKANMAITKLLDVEEHVWSPMYGLKGNIDATVEVAMLDGKDKRILTVPFEVKTGKHANSNHIAQTALYTLLMSDRYDIDIAYGVLYYMETSRTMRIPAIQQDLKHMIMQRNQLACHVRERSVQLPRMLKNKHMCGQCYAKTTCFVYHRLADDGNGETSGLDDKFEKLVQHLTPAHQEFFIKWENLLTKEEKDSMKNKRELWTMTSVEREKKSRCFADVIIDEDSSFVDADNPRINRFHYTFVKRVAVPGFSFLESELNVGEPVVVSDEDGHYALAIGYVTTVRKNRISVAVDRRLHNARIRQPGFDAASNQVFAGIMEVTPGASSVNQAPISSNAAPIRYRLDQDEFSNGMATVRNNLVQMMADEVAEATRIRQLIVDLVPPRFKTIATQYSVTDKDNLNVDQQQAIEKVMSAKDYALVLGMPGTGKTTTIAHIIRALVSQGNTVLLTSHTHTAVDNILLKLRDDNIPILRLGAPAKVHPEVQDFATLAGLPRKTFEEVKEAWHGTPVVATTCLGINHPVFLERAFDYCIVDEASQITLPICAGPIRMSRTFVLVGDHNQLPPVVRNEEAREGGLDVSLFKLLSEKHPQSVVNLAHQYRMCEDIMTLSNTLIYKGQLRCGTEELKSRKLDIPNFGALRHRHYDSTSLARPGTPRSVCAGPTPNQCWLHDVLESEARVRFINTDTVEPRIREEAQGKRIVNSSEVRIVSQLVESLLTIGIPANEIGVMSHYRAQLFMLKDRLKGCTGVEMHTTDRFQGRDKEVVVLSLVRSNDACNIGDLLRDWRRINVAFTRAKTKLLVIGSMSTLRGSHTGNDNGNENMLSRFIQLMEERDWIYNMPKNALEDHYFEEIGTQTTAAGLTQKSRSPKKTPKKLRPTQSPIGKENKRPSPKRAKMGERVLLKGKVVMGGILREMTNGAY